MDDRVPAATADDGAGWTADACAGAGVPVLLGLGANVGDRAGALEGALERLGALGRVRGRSPIYQTSPMYLEDQPPFLNMVALLETGLDPVRLLGAVKAIEHALGRRRRVRFGPREIDIDILAHGDRVVDLPTLTIPHPRLAERAFVLRPLADLVPTWRHPVSGQSVAALLAALPAPGTVVRLAVEPAGP